MDDNIELDVLDDINDEDDDIVTRFGLDNLKELDDMVNGRIEYKRFNNIKELMEDLEN